MKYYFTFLLNEFHLGLYYLPNSVNVIISETKLVVTIAIELMGDQSNMTLLGVGEGWGGSSLTATRKEITYQWLSWRERPTNQCTAHVEAAGMGKLFGSCRTRSPVVATYPSAY